MTLLGLAGGGIRREGAGLWCNVRMGAQSNDRGYIADAFATPIGFIDREPVALVQLTQLLVVYDGDVGRLQFAGDCAAALTGKAISFDGSGNYAFSSVSWDGSTFTTASFDAYPRTFNSGQWYLVEIN